MRAAHRVIYRFDPDQLVEDGPDEGITPAKDKDLKDEQAIIPPLTAVAPLVTEFRRDARITLPERAGLRLDTILAGEVRAWGGT